MKTHLRRLAGLLTGVATTLLVVVATIMLVRAFDARHLPELLPWHKHDFAEYVRAADLDPATSWTDLLAREDAVFAELNTAMVAAGISGGSLCRYDPDSRAYPERFPRNWNKSFEMTPGSPSAAVVLVHGLTDSPYSVRTVAEIFRDQGFYVLAPRMPGHGLAPSALLEARWQDWAAVVRIAVRHARNVIGPEAPLFLVGYSNGGTLVLEYTLDSLEDEALERPARLFLLSPALGITGFARLASWHRGLATIPYFEKFRWQSVLPEFDPFKYNSFPKIAGHQTWVLTQTVHRQLARLEASGRLDDLPPILAFQSLADATVLTEALVTQLFDRLSNQNAELVLFDVNRRASISPFVRPRYARMLDRLWSDPHRGYALTVITNRSADDDEVVARRRPDGGGEVIDEPLGLSWPDQIYSMSHVAIPFPPDDPVYGSVAGREISLGTLAPRGEHDVLTAPISLFTRLRYNPFFPYIRARIETTIDSAGHGADP